MLEVGGPRGHVFKRGHRGAPCCEEMYLDLGSITSDDNAMLRGSDGQNYQSGGGAFVGLGAWCPHSIKYLLLPMTVC